MGGHPATAVFSLALAIQPKRSRLVRMGYGKHFHGASGIKPCRGNLGVDINSQSRKRRRTKTRDIRIDRLVGFMRIHRTHLFDIDTSIA